jgi:hypothetical protein
MCASHAERLHVSVSELEGGRSVTGGEEKVCDSCGVQWIGKVRRRGNDGATLKLVAGQAPDKHPSFAANFNRAIRPCKLSLLYLVRPIYTRLLCNYRYLRSVIIIR